MTQYVYPVGTKVRLKSDPSRIGVVEAVGPVYGGLQFYKVFFGGRDGAWQVPETDLWSISEPVDPIDTLQKGLLAKHRDFQRLITYYRLQRDYPLRNNIFAYNASRTRFYPYQFKPLVKFLDSPKQRILICDEVGLGKTIEAGLILTELRARQTINRVLVVCPSNLREKWRLELRRRFGEEFRILGARDLRGFMADYQESPETTRLNAIASLESCRTDGVLSDLGETLPVFDLVIIDEAHHMRNFGRKQRQVGILLSHCAGSLVLLTATPVHLGSQDLGSLLNILDDEEFADLATTDELLSENESIVMAQAALGRVPPKIDEAYRLVVEASNSRWVSSHPLFEHVRSKLQGFAGPGNAHCDRAKLMDLQRDLAQLNLIGHVFTRTRKREVHDQVSVRHASAIELEFTPQEQSFYDTVTQFLIEEATAHPHGSIATQWLLNMPQRRMASCIPAMVEHYQDRLGLDKNDLPEDFEDVSLADDFNLSKIESLEDSREKLMRLLSRWPRQSVDTKCNGLIRALDETRTNDPQAKILIFSFFKGTLRYLHSRLSEHGLKALVLSGDVPSSERMGMIDRFRTDDQFDVMLCSRVGSEGLDLQFCHTMVNYDLPWNPMEVEQRIGRLDRIGQESPTITIINFWVKGTVEERILRRLYDRIGIFKRSVGELEAILGDVVRQLEREIFSQRLTAEEQERRYEETERLITNRMKVLDQLENEAGRFLSSDEYFLDQIRSIKECRRYVTGEQLRVFLSDFIRRCAPKSRLKYDDVKKIGTLYPAEDFQTFIKEYGNSIHLGPYLDSAGSRDGISFTHESGVAFENPLIEFMTVLHPVIQAIAKRYAEDVSEMINAHHVVLATDKLVVGYYFYFVFRQRVNALRVSNNLDCVLIDQDLEVACDFETAESILGEMVELGQDADDTLDVDTDAAGKAGAKALEKFLENQQNIRKDIEATNTGLVQRRLTSIQASYEKSLAAQKRRLGQALAKGSQERYQRMLRGTINRLEDERDRKLREIEQQRTVTVKYDQISAGVLEVIAPVDQQDH